MLCLWELLSRFPRELKQSMVLMSKQRIFFFWMKLSLPRTSGDLINLPRGVLGWGQSESAINFMICCLLPTDDWKRVRNQKLGGGGGRRGDERDDKRRRWEGDTEKYRSGTESHKERREGQACSDRWEEKEKEEAEESSLQIILLGSDVLHLII